MEIFGLAVGMFLPWVLGVVWLRVRWLKAEEVNWPTLLGYGYLAGALATGMVMRLLDLVGIRLGFATICGMLIALIVAGVWAGRGSVLRWPNLDADWHKLASRWQQAAYAALLVLIIIRLVGLGLEVVLRPLFPWDAWSQWATKARVWYEMGRLVPFVSGDLWLGGKALSAYTDTAPHYPSAIPLMQTWISFSLGRWDDSLINLPWILCALALGLAFYGQARRWPVSPLCAMIFTYILLSLPILNSHVALAGYADLFMGTYLGLAAMAFFHWTRSRNRWQGLAALLFALGCAFIKQPGVIWMLTFVPALWIAISPRAGGIILIVLAVASVIGLLMLEMVNRTDVFGYVLLGWHSAAAWEPFLQNMLILDNWHLLWYLTLAVLLISLPRLFSESLRSMTVLVFAAFAFLGIIFCFTSAQTWAEDFTTLNRAYLHMIPMLVFFIMVLLRERVRLPNWIYDRHDFVVGPSYR